MISYTHYSEMWDAAIKSDSLETFTALWSGRHLADTFILNAVYDMAHGGVRRIRAIIGLSQARFSERYEIPRRSLEDWETGKHLPTSYAIKMLGFSILADIVDEDVLLENAAD